MLNRMMTVGNRWTKGNMDRVYVNNETMTQLLDTEASNGVRIGNWFNRRERQNLKVYYDVNSEEIVVTAGDEDAKEELKKALIALVAPVEKTTVEVTTFEEGKEYAFTKVTNAGTWRTVTCRVTKRTAKFVTLENAETGATVRKKIKVHSARNCEYVIPLGIDGNSASALWANVPTESEPEVEFVN